MVMSSVSIPLPTAGKNPDGLQIKITAISHNMVTVVPTESIETAAKNKGAFYISSAGD
jgi:hypothetical protein